MTRVPSADRRAMLVQAAIRVIAAQGIAGATTRAIVAEAGMSLASFHYAFRSRDEMMRELVAWVVGAEATAAVATLRPGGDIRTAIRDALQSFLDLLIADPVREQVLLEVMQYSLRTPELAPLLREQYESYHSAVRALLVDGAEASGVSWTVPVDDVARFVVTVTDGVTMAWLADRDAAAAGRVLDFAATSLAALARPIGATADSAHQDSRRESVS